jgi:outer membrane protein assembly factor BamB
VVWGNSENTVLHVADSRGVDIWTSRIGEVLDAPKAVADLDGDGRLDLVVASCGAAGRPGGLRAFEGASGRLLWTAAVGGCYQSAPLVFDQDGDGLPDVVVSTWFDNKVRAFSGRTGQLRWETPIGDDTYHAGSFGDLTGDGVPDVAIGDFSATLWAIDGATGTVLWQRFLEGARYVFGPTAMGDVDGDGTTEIAVTGENLQVFDAAGRHERTVELPGYCTRGPVLVDVDDDGRADIVTALDGPRLQAYDGADGRLLYDRSLPGASAMDFHPAVGDLDGDGVNDAFVVYGRGQSDTPEQNWGKALAVPLGGHGPGWPSFSHDVHHSGNYGWPAGPAANTPRPTAAATATQVPTNVATMAATATATASATATATPPRDGGCWVPYAVRRFGR